METYRLGSGITIVDQPRAAEKFTQHFDDELKDQIRDAIAHQSPQWVDSYCVEIVSVAHRTVRRRDADDRPFSSAEMLITAHILERHPVSYAMPIYALLEHWADRSSTGTVVREMWAQGRNERFPIMRVNSGAVEFAEPYARWQLASEAWRELRAYAEGRDAMPGR